MSIDVERASTGFRILEKVADTLHLIVCEVTDTEEEQRKKRKFDLFIDENVLNGSSGEPTTE